MEGNIPSRWLLLFQITKIVLTFITKHYEKFTGDDQGDNCKLEADFAAHNKTTARMIAVVMGKRMKTATVWNVNTWNVSRK